MVVTALWRVTTRMGVSNTYLSMGMEHFSLMLFDNPRFVLQLMDIFVDWACKAVPRICELGFDFMVIAEDLAWKQGPLFSPKTVRELFIPRMKKVAEKIKLPWIYHSDGNLLPILDDLLSLGMNGVANVEPNAMDIADLKKRYGHRICLMGNIDLHYTLTQGTPEETEAEVKKRIQEIGPGGGYILASSNGSDSVLQTRKRPGHESRPPQVWDLSFEVKSGGNIWRTFSTLGTLEHFRHSRHLTHLRHFILGGNMEKLYLYQWTWAEVRDYLKKDSVIILPFGSTEQHGLHLPLGNDALVAIRLAEDAARVNQDHRGPALLVRVVPPPHGLSGDNFHYPRDSNPCPL